MERNNYTWIREGYIGHNILCSSSKSTAHNLTFAGAEWLSNLGRWKVNFILSYSDLDLGFGHSSNIYVITNVNEEIRFENYLGVKESFCVDYRIDDQRDYNRFFPIKHIKILSLDIDFIEYEVHCL